ncbi:response regulator transcription factor [Gloeobacter kilaueensis]|uniref:Two component LuxR family transcriptional regulator n=1 Tax=Gloeobacter kilaueensis (strain ATCC BAA-2537 / CCAP 1431/1 / ULC 316 / JS1) TaxID=1183438 RepID=U5QIB7_GLOK1|nr:LuxR C-terminal-related transcriptional regulator [Gloeobacter kilaueensis]AGY57329.1 two component LuxR family transcriptional regulator [Gloeobacter kilaueensis JS1]
MALRFIVVEDHPEVAKNNCEWLQKVDGDAYCEILTDPIAASKRLKEFQPDLLVVDLLYGQTSGQQSGEPGLNLLREVFQNYPNQSVMVYSSEPLLLTPLSEAIGKHEGGFAAVNKMDRRTQFLEGAKSALSGELKIPRELRGLLQLTEREVEVLSLICKEALTDQAVADRIYTSKKTVQNHVQRLKEKLGIALEDTNETNGRVALCIEAMRRKLVQF